MKFTQEKVAVNDLVQGMFIARLDRPWVGTPFPIQGFHIKHQREIQLLRTYCKYVYVDTFKSGPPPDKVRRTSALDNALQPNTAARLKAGEPSYRKVRTLKQELGTARRLHEDIQVAVGQVIDAAIHGQPINLSTTRKIVSRMIDSILRNPDASMWIARMRERDVHIYHHCIRAAILAITLGRHFSCSRERLEHLAMGVLLSEIGYTRLPAEILTRLDNLNSAETVVMQQHVANGVEILKNTAGVHEETIAVVRTHHERFDGSGFPAGLKGDQIPLLGKIAGIVDVYDSLTTPRCEDRALAPASAMSVLHKMRDREFQGELVEEFIQAIGVYPTGTLIELSTGEIGVITEQNTARRLRPRLLLILGKDKTPLRKTREIDLMSLTSDTQGNPLNIVRSLPGTACDIIDLKPHRKGLWTTLLGFGNALLR